MKWTKPDPKDESLEITFAMLERSPVPSLSGVMRWSDKACAEVWERVRQMYAERSQV